MFFAEPLCPSTSNTAKNGIGCLIVPEQAAYRKGLHIHRLRGSVMGPNASPTSSQALKQLSAADGLAIVRVTIGAMLLWVFFENLGKGLYTPAGYAGPNQFLPQGKPRPGCLEGGDGPGGKPRRDGRSHAGLDGNLTRYPAPHRPVYPAGRICGFSVSRQPLDFGVRHLVDLGAVGSGAGIARARDRARRPQMGC